MSARKYTNTAELVRLSGLSRERVQQYLDAGRIAGAYLEPHGTRGVWRIPVKWAEAWLKSRGINLVAWGYSWDSLQAIANARTALAEAQRNAVFVALETLS